MTEKGALSELLLHVKNRPCEDNETVCPNEDRDCGICPIKGWIDELVGKTQTLRQQLESLESKAKTAYQIHDLVQNNLHHTVDLKDYKWVALDDVKELLGGCQEPSCFKEEPEDTEICGKDWRKRPSEDKITDLSGYK